MSSEWPRVQISDACDLIVDCVNKTAPRVDHATPYKMIRTPNIRNGRIDLTDCRFVERETFEKWTRRAKIERDDVLLTREAPMGEVGLVDFDDTVFLGQRIMQYRVNKSILLPRFLLYSFLSPDLQNQFRMHDGTGSVVSHIRVPDCSKFELNLPPLAEQERITAILGSLDDKIQLNHQINQTLEQIAQAIFKSWFVDFEPVKAKIAALETGGSEEDALLAAMQAISGKGEAELTRLQAEQPEQYAELRATAELFPSAMQDSELGEIPEGWNPSTVGHEFDVTMGQSPPGDTYNEEEHGAPFFQGRRDFGERFPKNRVYCSAPKRMANKGDTLLSVRAPVGDTNIALTNCCIGRGLAALRHRSGCASFTYYSVIQLGHEFSSYDSEGTVFGSINQKNLKALPVVVPTREVLSAFTRTVGAIDDLIREKSEETVSLSTVRDTLLPKLLSGELSVSGAEPQLTGTEELANV